MRGLYPFESDYTQKINQISSYNNPLLGTEWIDKMFEKVSPAHPIFRNQWKSGIINSHERYESLYDIDYL